MNEGKVQEKVIQAFRKIYPKYAYCIFSIENKRVTTKGQGAKLKRQGVTAGVADLCLALPTQKSGALYIEMKFGKNKQSKAQKEWQKEIEKNGNTYVLAYSVYQAFEFIIPYIQQHELWKLRN